jgi:hypothetical protein
MIQVQNINDACKLQDPEIRKFYRFYILKIQMFENFKVSVPFF